MRYSTPASSRNLIVGALICACLVAASGCLGRGGAGTLDQLSVTQYRYNIDAEHDLVRVYGVVRNSGEGRTPAADLVVTLLGRSGSMKGQDRVEVPALRGGDEHEFALQITSHGRTSSLDMQIVPRGEALPDESEDQPDASDGADNG